ncbi:tyrosine-type recombinase/integrase [Flagellimonas sp.]|jgi:integrase|uniref:tyrosine-type recombinase/integrase n=1 Tax=Flagellimonas sp. TaxID=2058762 RepID=UPI003BA87ADC
MDELFPKSKSEHINEYIAILSKMAVKMYSEPKLYIPKDKEGRPDLSKRWYVYFYYRNPKTGNMDKRPFKHYRGINRYKTVRDRKRAGKQLLRVVNRLLRTEYNPFVPGSANKNPVDTVKGCFETALEHKKPFVKETTYNSYEDYLNMFLDWASKNSIARMPIDKLTRKHISGYLNYLGREKPHGKGLMPTSIANHKGNLSALMGQMVMDDIIPENFIAKIPTKKNKPTKNQPFSMDELKELRKYTKEHEPVLYNFLQFIFYSFMRNNEIARIQIKHINMDKRIISIETKGEKKSHILMIDKLYRMLKDWNVANLPKDYYLFTPEGVPGKWEANVKSRVDYFSERFAKVKTELKLPKEKNSYSLRHNAAVDLFKSFMDQGMAEQEAIYTLIQITRHKSEGALRKYLRDVGAILPKDWSEHYNISF